MRNSSKSNTSNTNMQEKSDKYVTIKALESVRDDLKLIAALTKEKQQDALKRVVEAEKARLLKEQAKEGLK